MSSNLNAATKEGLSQEINWLRNRCRDHCNIIENSNLDRNITPENVGLKAFHYIDAVRTDIQKSDTPIPTDENLITSEFLAEMKEKTEEADMLSAFIRGRILDVDNEIQRINSHTRIAEEALAKPRIGQHVVQPEHIEKTKNQFRILKTELHKLIQSVFPEHKDAVVEITGILMQEKFNEESNGYISITEKNYKIIELLKDMCIVTENPYNKMEVKLAY